MTSAKPDTLALPKVENTICLSPEYQQWADLLLRNKNTLRTFENSLARQKLLNVARFYTSETLGLRPRLDSSESVVVTGHQANWHHCGILAKDIVACRFARDTNGCAVHLVLDHDITNTSITLPAEREDGTWHTRTVGIQHNAAPLPLELCPGPECSQLADFIDTVSLAQVGSLCTKTWPDSGLSMRSFRDIADTVTYMHAVLHSALGLKMLYLPISLLSESEAFMDFTGSIIFGARLFAATYNTAIEEHVKSRRIDKRCTLRTLLMDNKAHLIELPFWLVSHKGTRASLQISSESGRITIGEHSRPLGTLDPSDEYAAQLKSILNKSGYSIRPKAVTLTLFARLYLTDWFIHGLGAAAYEFITDHILADFYNLPGLAFGTATATMTLPLAQRISKEIIPAKRLKKLTETINDRGFFFGLFSEQALRELARTMPHPKDTKGNL